MPRVRARAGAKHDDQVDAVAGAYNKLAVRAALDTSGIQMTCTEEETAEGTAIGHVPTPGDDTDLLSYVRDYGQGASSDRAATSSSRSESRPPGRDSGERAHRRGLAGG